MKTRTGYLTRLSNPQFSGLATVVFRSAKRATKRTTFITCYCEAGFGVRQIVGALGDGYRLTQAAGEVKLRYAVDEFGMLAGFEIAED